MKRCFTEEQSFLTQVAIRKAELIIWTYIKTQQPNKERIDEKNCKRRQCLKFVTCLDMTHTRNYNSYDE